MSTTFLQQGLWEELTAAVRKGRADVAVAYFGKDGNTLLPLVEGSRLVVDASPSAVRSGQTYPLGLLRLYRKGVAVYSKPGLHAKVVVIGSKAYVGSANASRHSAHTLVEAAVVTNHAGTVRKVRAFIDRLADRELGEAELKSLVKQYRPPKIVGGVSRAKGSDRSQMGPRVWIAAIKGEDLPEAFTAIHEEEGRKARKHMEHPRRHELDDFWWTGACPYAKGDIIIQVFRERGKPTRVLPPGTVLRRVSHVRGGQRKTFVYLEVPNKRPKLEKVFAKQIGAGSRGIRPGPLGAVRAERVLKAWRTPSK